MAESTSGAEWTPQDSPANNSVVAPYGGLGQGILGFDDLTSSLPTTSTTLSGADAFSELASSLPSVVANTKASEALARTLSKPTAPPVNITTSGHFFSPETTAVTTLDIVKHGSHVAHGIIRTGAILPKKGKGFKRLKNKARKKARAEDDALDRMDKSGMKLARLAKKAAQKARAKDLWK